MCLKRERVVLVIQDVTWSDGDLWHLSYGRMDTGNNLLPGSTLVAQAKRCEVLKDYGQKLGVVTWVENNDVVDKWIGLIQLPL